MDMGNTDKFEQIATIYDTPERVHIASVSADAIRKFAVATKEKIAIDFGCGTGLVGLDLLDAFHSILFLDSSPNMIKQVQQKITALRIPNAATMCFDFETEVTSDLHADYIFMAQVLLHIKDVEFILTRLYDVLNPGGHLLIVDFNKNENIISDIVHNGFDQIELTSMMTKLGYKNIQSETIYEGTNIFMGQDASMFILNALKKSA